MTMYHTVYDAINFYGIYHLVVLIVTLLYASICNFTHFFFSSLTAFSSCLSITFSHIPVSRWGSTTSLLQ